MMVKWVHNVEMKTVRTSFYFIYLFMFTLESEYFWVSLQNEKAISAGLHLMYMVCCESSAS